MNRPTRSSRAKKARKAWLAAAMRWPAEPWPGDDETPNHAANSNRPGHEQSVPAADGRYKERVAEPCMTAVLGLPASYRALVDEIGYIEGYLAWKRRVPVDVARARAGR